MVAANKYCRVFIELVIVICSECCGNRSFTDGKLNTRPCDQDVLTSLKMPYYGSIKSCHKVEQVELEEEQQKEEPHYYAAEWS
jgi:hypothetical protein